jgi:hypothetical protein
MKHKIVYQDSVSSSYQLYTPTDDETAQLSVEEIAKLHIPNGATYWIIVTDEDDVGKIKWNKKEHVFTNVID